MKKTVLIGAALSLLAAAPVAQAATSSYNVITTWFEPDTQPNDSIFKGTFDYDSATHTVSNLQGILSESMTGTNVGYPNDTMTWLTLSNQLVSWYDSGLEGTFAATFLNANTNTFWTGMGGDGWSPQAGVDAGGVYYGFPRTGNNPGNAYALIFVPESPTATLTQNQINKLAYADCAPGGMMGAVCMTGTSKAGYGLVGTMSGYPVSQTITAAVPEPESYAMLSAGLGLMGVVARRRRQGC
ncbi:MAG: PEP-CTERM sorting domain-containing protein [Ferribacterium limneticum]